MPSPRANYTTPQAKLALRQFAADLAAKDRQALKRLRLMDESDRDLLALGMSMLEAEDERGMELIDFVPQVAPSYIRPTHLLKLAAVFERIRRGERVRVLFDVAVQHGKTTLVLAAIPWLLRANPHDRIAYTTYNQAKANSRSLDAQDYSKRAGVHLDLTRATLAEWRTEEGGRVLFVGGTGLTGEPARVVIFDDPYSGREDADSAHQRTLVERRFRAEILTRLPEQSSVLVIHARWHKDDLIGALSQEREPDGTPKWEHASLPFLTNDDGEPDELGTNVLCPVTMLPDGGTWGWTVDGARQKLREVGPYDAASLYQGRPVPRGGTVFREPTRYDGRPDLTGARILLAGDPAGSDAESACHSVYVALACRGYEEAMTADLVGLLRLQARAEDAAPRIEKFRLRFGGRMHIENTRDGKDQQRAIGLQTTSSNITLVPAIGDKFLRAQSVAGAWNAAPVARVRVPARAADIDASEEDLSEFLRVVSQFTGRGGSEESDDVDALSHAWNLARAVKKPLASTAPIMVGKATRSW